MPLLLADRIRAIRKFLDEKTNNHVGVVEGGTLASGNKCLRFCGFKISPHSSVRQDDKTKPLDRLECEILLDDMADAGLLFNRPPLRATTRVRRKPPAPDANGVWRPGPVVSKTFVYSFEMVSPHGPVMAPPELMEKIGEELRNQEAPHFRARRFRSKRFAVGERVARPGLLRLDRPYYYVTTFAGYKPNTVLMRADGQVVITDRKVEKWIDTGSPQPQE